MNQVTELRVAAKERLQSGKFSLKSGYASKMEIEMTAITKASDTLLDVLLNLYDNSIKKLLESTVLELRIARSIAKTVAGEQPYADLRSEAEALVKLSVNHEITVTDIKDLMGHKTNAVARATLKAAARWRFVIPITEVSAYFPRQPSVHFSVLIFLSQKQLEQTL